MFPTAHKTLSSQNTDYLNTKERFLDFLRKDVSSIGYSTV